MFRLRKSEAIFVAIIVMALYGPTVSASPFTAVHAERLSLTSAQVHSLELFRGDGKIGVGGRSITFTRIPKPIRLVIHTGPSNDMLSFRINGLRNPTLYVSPGTLMQVTFINTDDDMFHDWRVVPYRATFPDDADELVPVSVGTPPLPAHKGNTFSAETIQLKAPNQPGEYSYYCTVRGHAMGGMHGVMLVERQ